MRAWLSLIVPAALFGQTATYVGLGNASTYTDVSGILWSADTGCSGGTQFTSNNSIQGTSDPTLYQHGRLSTSAFSCTYTVSNNIFYNITLKFANTQSFTVGQRVFNIFINNTLVKGSFDLAGNGIAQNSAFDLGFLIPVSNSQVSINLQPTNGGVLLNAISIVASGPGTLTGNNTFTGTNIFNGTTTITNLDNIAVVDGTKYTTIQAAINSFSTNPGIVLIPSNYTTSDTCAGCTIPQNVILWDLRSTENPVIGNNTISYNVNSAQNNISTSLIRASQQVVAPTKSGAAAIDYGFYSGSMTGANGQSLEGVNGGVQIYGTPTNIPGSLFVIGAENFSQLNTTGAGVTFPDLRGMTSSVQLLSPNTSSATRAVSTYGQACTVGGTGTIGTCVSGYFELPTAATGVNEAFHAEGQSSFGASPSSPRIILDRASTGVINIIGGTVDPTLGGNGHIFWRTDLNRFRAFDGSTWHSFTENDTTDTLTNKTLNTPLPSGTGLQMFNTTTTCTTGASVGAICTTANISLPVAEADTSYRITCTGKGLTNVPVVIATSNNSVSQFTITIAALTAAAASFTSYDCIAGHN